MAVDTDLARAVSPTNFTRPSPPLPQHEAIARGCEPRERLLPPAMCTVPDSSLLRCVASAAPNGRVRDDTQTYCV